MSRGSGGGAVRVCGRNGQSGSCTGTLFGSDTVVTRLIFLQCTASGRCKDTLTSEAVVRAGALFTAREPQSRGAGPGSDLSAPVPARGPDTYVFCIGLGIV